MSQFEIGVPRKKFGSTKVSNATWSKQSFSLFQQEQDENENVNNNRQAQDDLSVVKPNRVAPGGKMSSNNPFAASVSTQPPMQSQTLPRNTVFQQSNIFGSQDTPVDAPARASTRVMAAPGGRCSVKDIFADVPQEASAESMFSTRVHAAPGGKSILGAILNHETPEQLELKKKLNPQMVSSVFAEDSVAFKPSTKRLAPVGGQTQANIFAADATSVQPPSFHTAKANESQNIFGAPADEQRRPSISTAKKNQSSNVLNLTPTKPNFKGQRTYKANERSQQDEEETPEESQESVSQKKHSKHNEMMQSNVFATNASEREQQTRKFSTRVLSAPGGKTQNIFA